MMQRRLQLNAFLDCSSQSHQWQSGNSRSDSLVILYMYEPLLRSLSEDNLH